MNVARKLLYFLSARERKKVIIIMVMTITMAFLDMIGVASIMPFIAVLSNPEFIEKNFFLTTMYNYSVKLGVENEYQFLFILGIFVFVILIITLVFKSITNYAQLRFCHMREYSIGKRLIESYLHQPYSWFLNRDSSELGKTILSETSLIVSGGLKPMIHIISQFLVIIALVILLFLVHPDIALMTILTFSFCYGSVYLLARGYLKSMGQERMKANESRFRVVSEAFGAAKEVKIGRLEKNYVNFFKIPAQKYSTHQATLKIISQLPRYGLEALAFGGMIIVILYLMGEGSTLSNILPILAIYAFAGYRIMPALQQIYASISELRFATPAINSLYDDVKKLKSLNFEHQRNDLSFGKQITLNDINFIYPKSSRTVIKNISLNIKANSTVGFVGATGSGKSTVVDIILGLLEVSKGTIKIDNQILNENNVRKWQSKIGYVPQHIYLANDTIANNIAFGLEKKDINLERVETVSKIADLHDFVVNELSEKYQTIVGERGVRLSGGQLQRIGIARALYHNPKVLILDEATSALDNLTEQIVMKAINKLGKKITIILIAHRLSTVKVCENIFYLEKGELKAQGNFDELIKSNKNFSLMAKNDNKKVDN